MRDFKNMKRQRGRNRNGGGGNVGGGGGKPQQNANRAFDSNGPDNVKIRGHAQHVFEKYQQLARDAFSSGDRVVAENYLQHADHYFRVLRTLQPQRSPSEILGRDSLASGLDIDFEEEFDDAVDGGEGSSDAAMESGSGSEFQRPEAQRGDYGRNDGGRNEGGRNEGGRADAPRADGARADGGRYEGRRDERYDRNEPRRDTYESRDGRPERYDNRREEGGFRDRPESRGDNRSEGRVENRDRQDVRDRPNSDRPTSDRPTSDRTSGDRSALDRQERGEPRQDRFEPRQGNRRFEPRRDEPRREERVYGQERRDDRPAQESAATPDPLPVMAPEVTAQPFPSSAAEASPSPVLRSQDGGMSEAPAFLQPVTAEDGEVRKPRPRRRRAPRSFDSAEGGGPEGAPAESEEA